MDRRVLLENVLNGNVSFSVEKDTPESLQEFQLTVKSILTAESEGYISSVVTLKDYRHPGRLIRNISIRGGLTEAGKKFLSN